MTSVSVYVKARLGELGLQEECTAGDDTRTRLHPFEDGLTGGGAGHLNLPGLKHAGLVFDEHLPVAIRAAQDRILRYIQGDSWRRLPATGISGGRQGELVRAAIERASARREPLILIALAEGHRAEGSFPTLLEATAEAVAADRPNADLVVTVVSGIAGPGALDDHLDVAAAMASKDSKLVLSSILALEMPALTQHRDACLAMLRRADVQKRCKRILVKKVGDHGQGKAWFAGQAELLRGLAIDEDPDAVAAVNAVLRQAGYDVPPAATAPATQPAPGPQSSAGGP